MRKPIRWARAVCLHEGTLLHHMPLQRNPHQLAPRPHARLVEQLLQRRLHGTLRNLKLTRDFLIRQPLENALQNRRFPSSKGLRRRCSSDFPVAPATSDRTALGSSHISPPDTIWIASTNCAGGLCFRKMPERPVLDRPQRPVSFIPAVTISMRPANPRLRAFSRKREPCSSPKS